MKVASVRLAAVSYPMVRVRVRVMVRVRVRVLVRWVSHINGAKRFML